MFSVRDEVLISSSHQIPMPDGTLEPIHGHNWRIVVHIGANHLDPQGLVMDFNHLRASLTEVVDPYDHQHLNDIPPFDTLPSTAENLSKLVAERMAARVENSRIWVERVDVWMTDTGCATWFPPRGSGRSF